MSIKKNKFRITQSVSLAILYGNDSDKENETNYEAPADGVNLGDVADNIDTKIGANLGTNIEYSLKFIPGKLSNGIFHDNPFGFAFDFGLILAADKQSQYGFTFDGLLKVGIETGYDHSMGLGFDFLFGTGKSPGFIYFFDDATNSEPIPYTEWCLKNGFQFWVRSGLIKQLLPNSTTSIFVRYVYSQEPKDAISDENVFLFWQEEALQIGLLINFKF